MVVLENPIYTPLPDPLVVRTGARWLIRLPKVSEEVHR